ncbi:hypothetical protein M0R19_06650 [Candidatus Pacearchaeota archaeon]|nr:hypothetical protein [Candidatus Pacearchaeota archaeon]
MGMIENFLGILVESYNQLVALMPEHLKILPPLFIITAVITGYAMFIWFFHRFLAHRDVFKINLSQYNTYGNPAGAKLLAVFLYILEFIIIIPIIIFIWFVILGIFIIVLAKEIEIGSILVICAALISAIRITAYFSENLSRDLAKLLPFTLLAVAISTKGFLGISETLGRISEIPLFLNNMIYYLLFIFGWELSLRLLYLLFDLAGVNKTRE